MIPSNHLILCCPLLLLSSIFPSIRVFYESLLCSKWPKYWSFSFSISPFNEYWGLISFRIDRFDLLAVQRDSQEASPTPQFESINSSVLEKTPESPLDSKEINPVNPKGNQPWIFFGRTYSEADTPILWPHAKNRLTGRNPDAGKDWGQEKKGETEDEMVGWHHRCNGHESEQTPGGKDREAWCAAIHGVTKSQTWPSDWTEPN